MGSVTIPTVDMSKLNTDREEISAVLGKALESVGFACLENVPGFYEDELHRHTEWFFSLPFSTKNQLTTKTWNPDVKNVYRGYFPLVTNAVSYKEGYEIGRNDDLGRTRRSGQNIGLYEPNQWPLEDSTDGKKFREFMENHYQAMSDCGLEIMQLIGRSLGYDNDVFDHMFLKDPLSTLRLLHYPPRDHEPVPEARDGDLSLHCSDHTDSGFVTLLATFHYGGLQIYTDQNEWVNVEARPNTLIMNIGDLLARITGGKCRATRHRVIDLGTNRYSVPFFFEPSYDAVIEEVGGKQIRYGPWLVTKMKQFAEYKDTDFGITI